MNEKEFCMATDFVAFPKMPRLSRECVITEKIDGTNACVFIGESRESFGEEPEFLVGSRTRWITPEQDNHGFAKWAYDHKDELMLLGPGRHFGEWWGSGIQRGYGLQNGEKRFSLFNVIRWTLHGTERQRIETGDPRIEKFQEVLPACVGLVPVLYRGNFATEAVTYQLDSLRINGSVAAPSFMKPEGVVVFHIAGNFGFKKTIEKDGEPKGTSQAA
jgi:hypothetical protein